MDVEAPEVLLCLFDEVEDPRVERCKLHPLSDILVITLCAVICGADTWTEVELFGRAKFDWLRTFVCVESQRTAEGQTSTGRRYYISDLGGFDAGSMLDYVRGHWGIENELHWSLDVAFREDTLRNRVGHSAENLSRIRRLALNLLRRDKTCRAGIKGKRLQACLKDEY